MPKFVEGKYYLEATKTLDELKCRKHFAILAPTESKISF